MVNWKYHLENEFNKNIFTINAPEVLNNFNLYVKTIKKKTHTDSFKKYHTQILIKH